MQDRVFEKSAKKEISDIYTNQRFRIIEIKKSVEAHNPIIPYLTETKERVPSTNVFSENKDSKSKLSNNSGKSTSLKTKYISYDHPCYLRVAERRKTAEEVKLIALQPKKPAKRKIELLEKIFEIN